MADYGITKTRDQEFTRKTNDRLEFNSVVGKQIKESKWFASYTFNFRTQFSKGYTFNEEVIPETRFETTRFFSPAYIQTGPGLLWKHSDNLKVNISPTNARFIFVASDFTDPTNPLFQIDADSPTYFGVDEGETSRFEFGAFINAYAKFTPLKNITLENTLNLYSNYLEDPQNVDIDYTLNVLMKVNEYITTNVTFQAIYDDNTVEAFQIREALGIGVTYGF